MQFAAANPSAFQSMQDPNQSDSNVEVAQQTKLGESLGFTLKGIGVINDSQGETASGAAPPQGQQGQSQGSEGRSADNRPGGGLGIPIDAPDALQKYRWPIIFGFAVLLAIGGWVVTKRPPAASIMTSTGSAASAKAGLPATDYAVAPRTSPPAAAPSPPASRSSMLLEALKEELFQLEVEKKQGKITPEEYEKAKGALDQTLDRALKRQG